MSTQSQLLRRIAEPDSQSCTGSSATASERWPNSSVSGEPTSTTQSWAVFGTAAEQTTWRCGHVVRRGRHFRCRCRPHNCCHRAQHRRHCQRNNSSTSDTVSCAMLHHKCSDTMPDDVGRCRRADAAVVVVRTNGVASGKCASYQNRANGDGRLMDATVPSPFAPSTVAASSGTTVGGSKEIDASKSCRRDEG